MKYSDSSNFQIYIAWWKQIFPYIFSTSLSNIRDYSQSPLHTYSLLVCLIAFPWLLWGGYHWPPCLGWFQDNMKVLCLPQTSAPWLRMLGIENKACFSSTIMCFAVFFGNSQFCCERQEKQAGQIWSSNPTPGNISRQNYNSKRYTHTPVFIAALFKTAKTWKEPKFPLTDECIRRCGTYTQWNTTQP